MTLFIITLLRAPLAGVGQMRKDERGREKIVQGTHSLFKAQNVMIECTRARLRKHP